MRLLIAITACTASFVSLCAQSSTQPASSSESTSPASTETVGVPNENVEVKLKFLRWSQSNSVVISSFGDAPDEGKKSARQSQSEARAASRATRQRQRNDDSTLILWYNADAGAMTPDWKSLMMPPGKNSKIINYKGPREMVFYEKLPPRNETEEAYYRRKASFVIPSGAEDLYVMMFASTKTINFYPMNISPDKVGKDQIALINMAHQPVGVSLGDNKKNLLYPGKFQILKSRKKGSRVDLKLFVRENEEWNMLYGREISPAEDKRTILLIYDPFGMKQINLSVQTLTF